MKRIIIILISFYLPALNISQAQNNSQGGETPASMSIKGYSYYIEKNYAEAIKWFR